MLVESQPMRTDQPPVRSTPAFCGAKHRCQHSLADPSMRRGEAFLRPQFRKGGKRARTDGDEAVKARIQAVGTKA